MILSLIYQNGILYFNMMKDFLNKKITALELQKKYWRQRSDDLHEEEKIGYTDEYYEQMLNTLSGNKKRFQEKYSDYLDNKAWSPNCLEILKQYEQGAKELDIKGEMFFMGIWNFIDEYIREYNPSDAEYFNPKEDVDEKTLNKIIKAAYEVLERNKDRWLDLKE